MSPRANQDQDTIGARIPRTLFGHAHNDGGSAFPANLSLTLCEMIVELPDNWNGLDALIIKLLVGETWTNEPFNIEFNAGGDGEAPATHTQAVANHLITGVNGTYIYEDLTAEFAVFIALLNPEDTIWATIIDVNGIAGKTIALVIEES